VFFPNIKFIYFTAFTDADERSNGESLPDEKRNEAVSGLGQSEALGALPCTCNPVC